MDVAFCILMLLALLLALPRFHGKRVRRAQLAVLVLILLLCWMPTAWMMNYVLERPYLESIGADASEADAIIVFSGAAWQPSRRQPYPVPLTNTVLRTRHAAWVYSRLRVPIIVCGGRFTYNRDAAPVAELMRELLVTWGVPESDVILEDKGSSTYEQAKLAGDLLRSRHAGRIVVVTEAYHMRRAKGLFDKLGFATVPAACGFRSLPDEVRYGHFVPGDRALELTSDALRELAALGVYRLQGRI